MSLPGRHRQASAATRTARHCPPPLPSASEQLLAPHGALGKPHGNSRPAQGTALPWASSPTPAAPANPAEDAGRCTTATASAAGRGLPLGAAPRRPQPHPLRAAEEQQELRGPVTRKRNGEGGTQTRPIPGSSGESRGSLRPLDTEVGHSR